MVSFTLEQAPNTSVRPSDVSYESVTMPLTAQHGFRCPGTRGLHDLRQFYMRQRLRRRGANPLALQVRVPSLQTFIVFTL